MSAANLDEIKKKYNFKEISVATWRDPALSVHPARGGPYSPSLSAEGSYIPTYKVNNDLSSQPTDDDESEDDDENEELKAEVPIDTPLEELFEESIVEDRQSKDFSEESPSPEEKFDDLDKEAADELKDIDEQGLDPSRGETESNMAAEDDPENSGERALPQADVDAPEVEAQPDGDGASDPAQLEAGEDGAAVEAGTPSDAGSDERRVSFAPGTPDPKPTPRKKKTAKGTKGKKKRIAVPLDSLPADVMAMIVGAFEGGPPPPPAPDPPIDGDEVLDDLKEFTPPDDAAKNDPVPPEEQSAEGTSPPPPADAAPLEDEVLDGLRDEPPAETAQEGSLEGQNEEPLSESVPAPDAFEETPANASAPEPVIDIPTTPEKPFKKKSSKSGKDSGKDKDKSKKKSSKTKSRDISPPPSGLGIEIPPPPVLEIDGSINENPAPLAVEGEEISAETLEPENLEAVDGKVTNDTEPGPTIEDPPPTEDVPPKDSESNDPQLAAFEAPVPEQPSGDGGEEADKAANESAHNEEIDTSNAVPEQGAEDEDGVLGAWDQSDDVQDPLESTTTAEDRQDDHKDIPTETALSPADSGVEFGEDGGNGADNNADENPGDGDAMSELQSSEPTEKPAEASNTGGDETEEKATNVSTENEAAVQPVIDEPAEGPPQETVDEQSPQDDPVVAEAPDGSSKDGETPQEPQPDADDRAEESTPEENLIGVTAEDLMPTGGEAAAPGGDNASSVKGTDADNTGEAEMDAPVEDTHPAAEIPAAEIPAAEIPAAEILAAEILAAEIPAAEEEASYEPPSVESVPEEPKLDPFEAGDGAAGPDGKVSSDVASPDETRPEENVVESAKDADLIPEVPPSPNLSKSSSHGSHKPKVDHWERKHTDNALKEVLEESKVLERPHGRSKDGKDGIRVRDRQRKSRRFSSAGEDEGERRRRRSARRLEDAARLVEEEKRRAEDEERHRARRAARRAAAEGAARMEAEGGVKRDADTGRRRHRERDSDKGDGRTNRQLKTTLPSFTLPAIPKALNLTSGASVHGTTLIRSHGGAYRPAKEAPKDPVPTSKDEAEAKPAPRDAKPRSPPSPSGEKSHRKHRRHRQRSDGERSSRNHKDSERRNRRPSVEERGEERPRSFFGGLIRI